MSGQVAPGSRILSMVVAGTGAKDGMTSNRLFELDKIGHYTTQIRYKANGDPAGVSTSNIATFEINWL